MHKDITIIRKLFLLVMIINVSRKQRQRLFWRTIEIPQRVCIFKVNCNLKVHNAHLKVSITNFGIRVMSIESTGSSSLKTVVDGRANLYSTENWFETKSKKNPVMD